MQVRKYDVEHALPTQQLIVKQPELQAQLEHEIEGETADKKADQKNATDHKPEAFNLSKEVEVSNNEQMVDKPKDSLKKHTLDNRYKSIHKSRGYNLARLKFKQVKKSFRLPKV